MRPSFETPRKRALLRMTVVCGSSNDVVPRTQRSALLFAISAFTRVFDALWWCAEEPGP
jgi:hypothetical protein